MSTNGQFHRLKENRGEGNKTPFASRNFWVKLKTPESKCLFSTVLFSREHEKSNYLVSDSQQSRDLEGFYHMLGKTLRTFSHLLELFRTLQCEECDVHSNGTHIRVLRYSTLQREELSCRTGQTMGREIHESPEADVREIAVKVEQV